ncbi:MAG: CpaF family protein [Rhodocyclaceae bacterium]|nr:CpaF family protein [Rhodocyclaceae bacterium]
MQTTLSPSAHDATVFRIHPESERIAAPDAAKDSDQIRKRHQTFFNALGPIAPLFQDANVEEVMINRYDQIFFERRGAIYQYKEAKLTPAQLTQAINASATAARTTVSLQPKDNTASPLVYSHIGNLRIAAAIKPIAFNGDCMCIRVHRKKQITMDDIEQSGVLMSLVKPIKQHVPMYRPIGEPTSASIRAYLCELVASGVTILFAGKPGEGKSTKMNAMLGEIPKTKRVLVLEDTHEIEPDVPNRLILVANETGQVSLRDLLRFSVRARPDVLVCGEVRDRDADALINAANSGAQTLATLHAESAYGALEKLESLAMQANEGRSSAAVAQNIGNFIGVVIHMVRDSEGNRVPHQALRVRGHENGRYITEDIFRSSN